MRKESRPLVSIVIRAFNESKYIGKLLTEIQKQKFHHQYEVIVVDSGSTDRTVEIARSYGAKLVSIKPKDFTFGRSLNIGIRKSKGKYIVVVSAHCIPSNNFWLRNLVKPLRKEGVALVYGKQRGGETSNYSEKQIFLELYPEKSEKFQQAEFCNNANAAIKKSLWRKIPYNEELTGLEDLDWAKKVKEIGYSILYNPKASVLHYHEESGKLVYRRYKREAMAFCEIYPQSQFRLQDFFKLLITNSFSDLLSAYRAGGLPENVLEILTFRFFQAWGTYRGHRSKKEETADLKKYYYQKGELR